MKLLLNGGRRIVARAKLTLLFLLLVLVDVQAGTGQQKVTLHENNASLKSVFDKITRQTGYVFFYNDDLLKEASAVTLHVKNMPLEEALEQCFRNQPLEYFISNKTVAVKKKENIPAPQARQAAYRVIDIRGRVLDAQTNEPIAGVSVMLKGSTTGTVTNKNGEFGYIFPQAGIVQFSSVGYELYELNVSESGSHVVRLKQTVQTMKQTVVTGIFNRRANTYTGSTVTYSSEDLRKVGNANVFQALKNLSPSLMLDNFSMGSSPNAMPDIQLRGTSTFPQDVSATGAQLKGNYIKNPNEPLFILDGFEATAERIFDLDINRIERVTILKDAASKAIYGAKAANGVIVVETRKSASGQAVVSYNASVDVELPDLTSYNLANSLEKLEAERIDGMYIPTLRNDAEGYAVLQQRYNDRKKRALEGLSTDWLAKPLQNGVGQKHTITVELGGENLNMIADASYREVNGAMKGSKRRNISGNITTSYRVKNLLFRNIMGVNKNQAQESPYGTFQDYAIMNPYWRATNADGTIPYYSEIVSLGDIRYTNPLYNAGLNTKIVDEYLNFTNNFYIEWTIKPGLRAIGRVGFDMKNSSADEFYPAAHTRFEPLNRGNNPELKKRSGSYQVNNGKSNYISGDFNLTYSKEVDRHFFFANGGFNVSERKFDETIHLVEGFSSDRMDNIIFGRDYALESRPTGLSGVTRDMGFLGAFSYMYDNRFLTDITLRTNASSQFGADKRWAQFWSLGLGWNLHNEKFMQRFNWIEQFKIRGSMGSTGNPNFATNSSIATYTYYLESMYQGFPGSYVQNMANAALQWETKQDYNLGFDARIKGLTMRFDYYESFTENLITNVTLPNSTGFNTVKENLGRVKNSGLEIFATYLLWSKGRNFVSVNAGIETNRNKIVSLSNAMKASNDRMDKLAADRGNSKPVNRYVDGISMNAIWAVPSLGIDPSTGNEIYVTRDGHTTYEWNANDMIVAGNSMPHYQGILGFTAEYRGIGVNVTGRYLGGGQLYNQTLVDKVENVDMNYNVDRRVLTGRWTKPGQQALFKRLGNYGADPEGDGITTAVPEKTRATTRFVQDRNEWNIGAVNLYYLFNPRFIGKFGMQRLKLAFNMNEVATFSSIRIERGTQYPFARTMSVSLSTTFK